MAVDFTIDKVALQKQVEELKQRLNVASQSSLKEKSDFHDQSSIAE